MLSCKVGVTNVNVIDYNEKQLRSWSGRGLLKCPVCGEKLIYKHGLVRIPHFSHEKDKECIYTYFENETKEHHLSKIFIYNILKNNKLINNLELESYIPETKQRPDLCFEFNGLKYVVECQCSPITVEEIQERKELYKLNNIIDIWIFGAEKFNENKPIACQNFLDTYLILNPFEEQLVLRKNNGCRCYKILDDLINILLIFKDKYYKMGFYHSKALIINNTIDFLFRNFNTDNYSSSLIISNLFSLLKDNSEILIKIEPNDSIKDIRNLDEYFNYIIFTGKNDIYLKGSDYYKLENIISKYKIDYCVYDLPFKVTNNRGYCYYI